MTADPNDPIAGFPISYTSFTNGSGFTVGGNATVTGGALRLTSALASQSGFAVYNTPFASSAGLSIQFTYVSDGYNPAQGSFGRADGISFFLLNGDLLHNAANVTPGGVGGGLGYSEWGGQGITNGFLGVGLDTYGNYANAYGGQKNLNGTSSTLPLLPNEIGIRGQGSGTSGYDWITGQTYAAGIDGTRTVRINLLPRAGGGELLDLYMSTDGGQTFTHEITQQVVNQTLPSQFYFGFAASTGGGNDVHAINNIAVTLPTDLQVSAPSLTAPVHASLPTGTLLPGDSFSYTYTLTNTGPNASSEITLNDALPANAGNVQWSVQDDNHGVSSQLTGTGAIALNTISLGVNHVATVTVSGTIRSSATSGNLDHVVTVGPGAAYSFLTPSNGQHAFTLGGNAPLGFVNLPATVAGPDTGPLTPFAQAILFDNTGGTDTLTVTIDPTLGSLSSAVSGATYDATTGRLSFTGTSAQAQSVLNGLVFVPAGTHAPGQGVAVPLALRFSHGSDQASGSTVLTYAVPPLTARLASDTGPSATDGITSSGTLTGTSDPGATVAVLNGTTVLGTTTAGVDGHWSVTPTLADGRYTLTVRATGLDGAKTTVPVQIGLDTATPTLTAATVSASGTGPLGAGAVVTFIATASEPLAVSAAAMASGTLPALTLSNGRAATLDVASSNATHYVFRYTVAAGDDTSDLQVTNLALNGAGSVTNLAGTPLNVAATMTALGSVANTGYVIDTTAPAAPSLALDAASGRAGRTTDATPRISGTAEPGSTVRLYAGSRALGTAAADAVTGAWTINSGLLATGVTGLTATATDAAGNVSALSAPVSVTVASAVTAALAKDSGASGTDGVTNDDTLTGKATPGSTVTLLEGKRVLAAVTAGADGSWTASGSALGLADGAHAITASGPDASGNPASAEVDLTLVTAAPSVRFDATETVANTPLPTLSGTATNNATVAVLLNGQAVGSTVADATGHWAYQLASPLTTGSYGATAQATDVAGNVSPISDVATLIEIASPSDGTSVADDASLTLAQLVGSGSKLQFVDGTQAVRLADGVLSVGPDTQQSYLARLYQGLLGRPQDSSGIGFWNGQLDAGLGNVGVAQAFLDTGEGRAATPGLTDGQFVQALYQGLLGRAGGESEAGYWTDSLANGASRAQVLAAIADSPESRQALASATKQVWAPDANATLIEATYETAFGRPPELGGLQYWLAGFRNGLSVPDFEQAVAALPEFVASHGSQGSVELVTTLYQNGLGRAPGSDELASAVGALQAGTQTPGGLLATVATSAEANAYVGGKLALNPG